MNNNVYYEIKSAFICGRTKKDDIIPQEKRKIFEEGINSLSKRISITLPANIEHTENMEVDGSTYPLSINVESVSICEAEECQFIEYTAKVNTNNIEAISFRYYERIDYFTYISVEIFESVCVDSNNTIRMHLPYSFVDSKPFYNPLDHNYDRTCLDFFEVIPRSGSIEKIEQLEAKVSEIIKLTQKLKSYKRINRTFIEKRDYVIMPIELTFSKSCLAKLYLLKDYNAVARIISKYGLLQIQCRINKNNEELLVLLCDCDFLDDIISQSYTDKRSLCKMYTDNPFKNEIGLPHDIEQQKAFFHNSTLFNVICDAQSIVDELFANEEKISNSVYCYLNCYTNYIESIKMVKKWIKETYNKAFSEYSTNTNRAIRWKNEFRLYKFIQLFFDDALFQYYPDWLNGLSLDIYIPSIKIAIEYQGMQHFKPVDRFGGDSTYENNIIRDKKKKELCIKNLVQYVEWKYDTDVLFENIIQFIMLNCPGAKTDIDTIIFLLNRNLPFVINNEFILHKIANKTKPTPQREPQEVIRQYNQDGNYLLEYNTLLEASNGSGVCVTSIEKCLLGQRYTAGGFYWQRENKESEPTFIYNTIKEKMESTKLKKGNYENTPKPVYQIDASTGEILNTYESIKKATKAINLSPKCIRDALSGKQKTAGGYIWKYK